MVKMMNLTETEIKKKIEDNQNIIRFLKLEIVILMQFLKDKNNEKAD